MGTGRPKVHKVGDNLELWGEMLPTLTFFADLVGKDVYVRNPHGRPIRESEGDIYDPDSIYINFWSFPENLPIREGMTGSTRYAFGVHLPAGVADSIEVDPSLRFAEYACRPIFDDDENLIALCRDNTLYVLFDLPHTGDLSYREAMPSILQNILDRYFEIEGGELPLMVEAVEVREAYIRACARRLDRELVDAKRRIRAMEGKKTELTNMICRLTNEQEKLQALLSGMGMKEKLFHYGVEFDKLQQSEHVKEIKVSKEGVLSCITDTVYLEYGGKQYEIGEFKIELGGKTRGGYKVTNLRVLELTGQSKYHHPHVFHEDGHHWVCFGNLGGSIERLIGEFEYALAVQAMVKFLYTFNPDGQYLAYLKRHWKPVSRVKEGKEKNTREE